MKYLLYAFLILIALISCNRVKEKAKNAINESGEIVGKTAGEFGKGVSQGVVETLKIDFQLSDDLIKKGLETGKVSLSSDSSGSDNVLVVYFITKQDFKNTIQAKVYDADGLEMGRTKISVNSKAGDAGYYEFIFDPRTNIDRTCLIVLD